MVCSSVDDNNFTSVHTQWIKTNTLCIFSHRISFKQLIFDFYISKEAFLQYLFHVVVYSK